MAVLTEKLYPPSIEGTIPAFYKNSDGTANLAVPFAMNRAVGKNNVSGLSLKIKTVQSNTLTQVVYCINPQEAVNSLVAKFLLPKDLVDKMMIGQYFKIQLAFVGAAGIGYYSTVGIVKFTAKPKVSIQDMKSGTNPFKRTYVGLYRQTGEDCDTTEKAYSFIFNLYTNHGELVQSSGWLLHNTSLDTSSNQIVALSESIDTYTFAQNIIPMEVYKIEYGVRTINGLEVYSQYYSVMEIEGIHSSLKANLVATNQYDNGYIELNLSPTHPSPISASGSYVLTRSCADTGFLYWDELTRFHLNTDASVVRWEYKDFTIEHGKTYQYAIQQYNDNGLYSARILSQKITAAFEDMFLFDGQRQLRIRFNPKVSSFKIDRLEQKIDTIGSKYPYVFRNGNVEYYEFPISGLVSYVADENELFISKTALGLEHGVADRLRTSETSPAQFDYISNIKEPTTQLVDYNIYAERLFKRDVLEWLGDGHIKMFKSPTEGNFLVRLLNVSMTPEDKLSRMLHTFTATAYQIADFNYQTLLKYNFLDPYSNDLSYYAYETVPFVTNGVYKFGKINNYTIAGWMQIQGTLPGSYVLQGNDSQAVQDRQKIYITNNNALTIDVGDTTLPDIYIPSDDPSQPGLIGSLTYRYITKQINRFSIIDNITIDDRAETYSGPVDIIAAIENNCKKELYKFHSVVFYRKPIVQLYISGSNYYQNYSNGTYSNAVSVNNLALDKIYKITRPQTNITSYYYLDYTENKQNLRLIEINGGLNSIDNWIRVNGSEMLVEDNAPNLTFDMEQYGEIFIGNGIAAVCSYSLKLIDYEIENTDEMRNLLASCGDNPDHPYYLLRLEELLTALESEEYEEVP